MTYQTQSHYLNLFLYTYFKAVSLVLVQRYNPQSDALSSMMQHINMKRLPEK
jgi:hypothetical protein